MSAERRGGPSRRTWRTAVAVFLTVFLGGLSLSGAAALWSQSGTVTARVSTGSWGTNGGDDGGSTGADGAVPVNLDSRLAYSSAPASATSGSFRYDGPTGLGFCHEFRVTNTSATAVTWSITFDTSKGPYWGLDPRKVKEGGVGTLRSLWEGATTGYDRTSGHWTLGGVGHNRTLAPGASTTVGYCANPAMPAVDPATFAAPKVSVDPSSNSYGVALRVRVSSGSRFQLPWAAEVDLADHVCASTLPRTITAENAELTRISGTRYRLSGTGAYRLIGNGHSQDFVFARYNPGGKPFQPGSCP
ncbi:hypothetical protein [Citricoccus sp.]|uniref:hypothetical protein n=1 Tax=Citricoccus sp. TaxID=1978372 RepID=UPI0028BD7EF6|nr:hypothetical protein [Citricoccus sp.]